MNQAILFENLHFAYTPDSEVLRGITLGLTRSERVALIGANGAGKSTLLLHANGLLTPSRGRVIVEGQALTPHTLASIRRQVGLVFQNPDDQLFMPIVEEDVGFGPANMRLPHEQVAERVEQALRAVNALDLRHRSTHQLSGGEKRRVAIATVLAMEPSIMVMDEPSAGLDPRSRRELITLLGTLNHTLLIATHDLDLARRLCHRTVIIQAGRVAADSATVQLLNNKRLMRRCGL